MFVQGTVSFDKPVDLAQLQRPLSRRYALAPDGLSPEAIQADPWRAPPGLLLVPAGTPWFDGLPGQTVSAPPDYFRHLAPHTVSGLFVLLPAGNTAWTGSVPHTIGTLVVTGEMGTAEAFDALTVLSDALPGVGATVDITMRGEYGDISAVFFNTDTGGWDWVLTVGLDWDGDFVPKPTGATTPALWAPLGSRTAPAL